MPRCNAVRVALKPGSPVVKFTGDASSTRSQVNVASTSAGVAPAT